MNSAISVLDTNNKYDVCISHAWAFNCLSLAIYTSVLGVIEYIYLLTSLPLTNKKEIKRHTIEKNGFELGSPAFSNFSTLIST